MAAERRMRQQRDLRRDAEHAHLLGRHQGQFGKLLGGRIRVDVRIADEIGPRLVGHGRQRAHGPAVRAIAQNLAEVLQLLFVLPDHAADHRVGFGPVDHDRGDHRVARTHDGLGRIRRDAAALGNLVEGGPVILEAWIGLRVDQLEMLAGPHAQARALDAHVHNRRPPDQDGPGQPVVDQRLHRAQHGFFLALGEHHAPRIVARRVEYRLHQQPGAEYVLVQPLTIGIHVFHRSRGDTGIHRGLGHGRGKLGQEPGIERLRNQVVGSEFHFLAAIGFGGDVGGLHARQLGNRVHAGHLHLVVDRRRPHVKRAAEDVGEAQDVVDLVGKVRATRRDQRIRARLARNIGHDFRHRVGQRQDDRFFRHALDHLGLEHARGRNAQEDIGLVDHVVQRTGVGIDRVRGLARIHLGLAALVDHPLTVTDHDVFLLQPHRDQQVQAGHAGCTGAGSDQPDLFQLFPDQHQAVDDRGRGDDGGAVLVVVEHRNAHARLERFLDLEALGRLDVLEIDAAEGGLQAGDDLDKPLGVGLVDLDVEHVDVGELLEQHPLSFHHRLGRQRADVAQAQHGRTVGDDPDQVAAGSVLTCLERIFRDLAAGRRDPRRIGQRQVLGRGQRLGRRNLDLARRRITMVLQRLLVELVGHEWCLGWVWGASNLGGFDKLLVKKS